MRVLSPLQSMYKSHGICTPRLNNLTDAVDIKPVFGYGERHWHGLKEFALYSKKSYDPEGGSKSSPVSSGLKHEALLCFHGVFPSPISYSFTSS